MGLLREKQEKMRRTRSRKKKQCALHCGIPRGERKRRKSKVDKRLIHRQGQHARMLYQEQTGKVGNLVEPGERIMEIATRIGKQERTKRRTREGLCLFHPPASNNHSKFHRGGKGVPVDYGHGGTTI